MIVNQIFNQDQKTLMQQVPGIIDKNKIQSSI